MFIKFSGMAKNASKLKALNNRFSNGNLGKWAAGASPR
jgi:hypothetical protein